MAQHKQQRTGNAATFDARMKLHLRLFTLSGHTYRVLTLRPGTQAAFSTNFFHNTWHIITDMPGARLLGRLLWGLAYQRQPNTLIALYGEHLRPTPFDADPSDPILLAPCDTTALCEDTLRLLKARLAHPGASAQTVRWLTFGLDKAAQDEHQFWQSDDMMALWTYGRGLWEHEQMRRWGGFVCYTAPSDILRHQALSVYHLGIQQRKANSSHSDWLSLAFQNKNHIGTDGDGEIQILPEYRKELRAAVYAREQALAYPIPNDAHPEAFRSHVHELRAETLTIRDKQRRRVKPA